MFLDAFLREPSHELLDVPGALNTANGRSERGVVPETQVQTAEKDDVSMITEKAIDRNPHA